MLRIVNEDPSSPIEYSFEIQSILIRRESPFQEILVVETAALGRVMLLDGAIQYCTRDEFFYHEMAAHPALHTHPSPRRVAIIGGGDGGTLREVLKHKEVEHVTVAEIDEAILAVAKEYLPGADIEAFCAHAKDNRPAEVNGAHGYVRHTEEMQSQVEAFFGQSHSPDLLFHSRQIKPLIAFDLDSFSGENYRSADLFRTFSGPAGHEIYPFLGENTLLLIDDPYETFINPSFSVSFSSENPHSSSLLSIKTGDFEVFRGSG